MPLLKPSPEYGNMHPGENRMPAQQDIDLALQQVKQQHWALDVKSKTATRLSASPLMLNSFVKSYIISKVSEKISALHGIHGVMVNIGGDMVISGDLDERIRISNPKADAENDAPLAVITNKGQGYCHQWKLPPWFFR